MNIDALIAGVNAALPQANLNTKESIVNIETIRQTPTYKALETDRIVAQGDILIFEAQGEIPGNFAAIEPDALGGYVVAHSETGHHHRLQALAPFQMGNDFAAGVITQAVRAPAQVAKVSLFRKDGKVGEDLVSYVKVEGRPAEIKHLREAHTHGTIYLPVGTWQINRQQQPTPEGWQRVTD